MAPPTVFVRDRKNETSIACSENTHTHTHTHPRGTCHPPQKKTNTICIHKYIICTEPTALPPHNVSCLRQGLQIVVGIVVGVVGIVVGIVVGVVGVVGVVVGIVVGAVGVVVGIVVDVAGILVVGVVVIGVVVGVGGVVGGDICRCC